jgi:diguanylate cyclase (GGDEF)-like protein
MAVAAPGSVPTRDYAGMLARAWQIAAVGGLALFVAHVLLGDRIGFDGFFNRYWYNALVLLAAVACVARVASTRSERAAWIAFAVGVGSWLVAEVIFDFVYGGDPPYPSVADAFYLAFYPACYVGLLLLVRSRLSEFSRMLWLDGATAALAAAALGAAVLFEVVLRSTDGNTSVIVTNLAYPLGDILLLSAVVGVFSLSGWRPDRTWTLIGAALIATTVADGIFLVQTATNTYREGSILDALWPASMLLLAAAVWQRPTRARVDLQGRPLLATSVFCGLIALAILSYDHFHRVNFLAASLAGATILAVTVRTGLTFRENGRILCLMRAHAITDALTGLGNRRRLVDDLASALERGAGAEPWLLAIYDLDGFKVYNDTFGHPAGDALLCRLASALETVAAPAGTSYRLGGDEFCVLADVSPQDADAFLEQTADALADSGEGFSVTASFGSVRLPDEASTLSDALRLADQRLYIQKRERSGRRTPHEMLLQALYERSPALRDHVGQVADTATAIGEVLGLHARELEELRLAARLHDVGKLAIPDAVLQKPGPLDVEEWAFIREHTLIGERILAAAPGLRGVARIVRATHERWDGGGYTDGLAGNEIPLAARIVAVCDAFSAMTTRRPYRLSLTYEQAIAELRRCSGTQFDPAIVDLFCALEQAAGDYRQRGAA